MHILLCISGFKTTMNNFSGLKNLYKIGKHFI